MVGNASGAFAMTREPVPEAHALGLPVLVRFRPGTGLWEVYTWDSAAGLEHVHALYEREASARQHIEVEALLRGDVAQVVQPLRDMGTPELVGHPVPRGGAHMSLLWLSCCKPGCPWTPEQYDYEPGVGSYSIKGHVRAHGDHVTTGFQTEADALEWHRTYKCPECRAGVMP